MNTKLARICISIILITSIFIGDFLPSSAAGSLETVYLPMISSEPPAIPTIIPDTTKVLDANTTLHLVSTSADRTLLTFDMNTPMLKSVQVGDVIVSGPTKTTPDGFLRKVLSIQQNNTNIVLSTEQATLEETFESVLIDYSHTITSDELAEKLKSPGITVIHTNKPSSDITIQFNKVVLYDEDSNFSTTYDQIVANGSIIFSPTFHLRVKIEDSTLKEFYSTLKMSYHSGFTISSTGKFTVKIAEINIYPPIILPAIIVPVGGIPVLITPKIDFVAGIYGSVFTGVSSTVNHTVNMTVGLQYSNNVWKPIGDYVPTFSNTPFNYKYGVSFKASVGIKFSLMVYGVIGPYFKPEMGLKLDITPDSKPFLKLYAGVEVSVGVHLKIFSRLLYDCQVAAINYWNLIYSIENSPNLAPYTPSYPLPSNNSLNQPTNLSLQWTGGDPDGDPVTYSVLLSQNNPPDIIVSADQSQIIYSAGLLLPDTHYYWKIIAKDSFSAITSGPVWNFTTSSTSNNPPNVPSNPSPIDGAVNQNLDLDLSWTGGDQDNDVVTYTVYLDVNNSNPTTIVSAGQIETLYHANSLLPDSHYYWKLTSRDEHGANTSGPVWSFFTAATPITATGMSIAGGYHYTCALTSSGGVKCWGGNYYGQIGDGTQNDRWTPVDVVGLTSGVTAITADAYHTCALTSSGGVKCWGYNHEGELGDGTLNDRWTPVDVTGLTSGVTAIAAGGFHSCALTSSGEVKCWGNNFHGQIGDGTNIYRLAPVDVVGLTSGVTAIAAGIWNTCALTSSGGVKCWGDNSSGQIGDGTQNDRWTPVDVVGLTSGVTAVVAGNGHTCALASSGGVKCWGYNVWGQVGDGTQNDRWTPVDVVGLTSGVTAIVAGTHHTCVVTSSGGVKCWGENFYGQIGDGTQNDRWTPVDVVGLTSGVTAIEAGETFTCALTSSARIKCWGSNYYGQVGDGTNIDRWTPVDVIGF